MPECRMQRETGAVCRARLAVLPDLRRVVRGIDMIASYYAYIAGQPCCACGAYPPSEVAHVRCVASLKTGEILKRGHKGPAAWAVLPLCPDCHRAQDYSMDRTGPEAFWMQRRRPESWATNLVIAYLIAYLEKRK